MEDEPNPLDKDSSKQHCSCQRAKIVRAKKEVNRYKKQCIIGRAWRRDLPTFFLPNTPYKTPTISRRWPASSECRDGNAPGAHAIAQVAGGRRVPREGRHGDFGEGPQGEGWDGFGEVIQQSHGPEVGTRLTRRVHDVDAKPQTQVPRQDMER